MRNVAILYLLVVFFPTLAFSQQTDASANVLTSDSEADALFEKYLEESRNLNQEFTPLCNQLRKQVKITIDGENIRDYFLWDREYCQPLFERSKQIMRRLTGCDDYLSMWEEGYMQKIIAATDNLYRDNKFDVIESTSVPYLGVMDHMTTMNYGRLSLLTLYTLAIIDEQRDNILENSVYENSEKGANLRSKWFGAHGVANPKWFVNKMYREKHINSGIWYDFPPRELNGFGAATFETSWYVMAIYSFKNERSENLLYELIHDLNVERSIVNMEKPNIADWAVYYLALSPNSARFLPRVKKEIQERIVSFQKEFPQKGSALSNLDGATRKPYLNNFRNLFESARDRYISVSKYGHPEKPEENAVQRYLALNLIRRLLILKQSLEFNEKVPENEKERFEIVRRELAISWALAPKYEVGGRHGSTGLKNGEERFMIYMAEYGFPTSEGYYWREGDLIDARKQWDAKAFYERELTRKDYYSEVQIEYIQKQLEIIDENEKQRIIMEQREREKERNK